MDVNINWLVIIGAAVAAMVIGAVWYSPVLFAKQWLEAVGKKASDINKSDANTGYMVAMVAALVQAYVLTHLVTYFKFATGTEGAAAGLQIGLWLWLGLVATTMVTNHVFNPNEPKRALLWINLGHYLAVIVAQSVIVAIWT